MSVGGCGGGGGRPRVDPNMIKLVETVCVRRSHCIYIIIVYSHDETKSIDDKDYRAVTAVKTGDDDGRQQREARLFQEEAFLKWFFNGSFWGRWPNRQRPTKRILLFTVL